MKLVNNNTTNTYTQLVSSAEQSEIDTIRNDIASLSKKLDDFNAIGIGEESSTTALQDIINAADGRKIILNGTYKIDKTLYLKPNTHIEGTGTIDATAVATDAISILGSNTLGPEPNNITISGITIMNAGRFGIQVYGQGYTYKPHDIVIENVRTENCKCGGVFINSASGVLIDGLRNRGGYRAVGTFSPIEEPRITKDINIINCFTTETIQYGYQTYYGENINIIDCFADCSLTNCGDKSCITIDRTNNVSVANNNLKNAINNQIFITGSKNVICNGNCCYGGAYGIQAIYNVESAEDADIKECEGITIANNTCTGYTISGIILNGVKNSSVISNTLLGGANSIFIMQATRGDEIPMLTQNISVIANFSDIPITKRTVSTPLTFIGNTVPSIIGVGANDLVFDINNIISLGFKQIESFGLLKRISMNDEQALFEAHPTSETTHKGFNVKYNYGKLSFNENNGLSSVFTFDIGNAAGKKDLILGKAGAGIVVKSPDGLISKRIGIDNTGELLITTV